MSLNRTQREPCGCCTIVDRRGNASAPVALMCPDHKAEYETRHAAAAADHARQQEEKYAGDTANAGG